jgi:hypothetical protein
MTKHEPPPTIFGPSTPPNMVCFCREECNLVLVSFDFYGSETSFFVQFSPKIDLHKPKCQLWKLCRAADFASNYMDSSNKLNCTNYNFVTYRYHLQQHSVCNQQHPTNPHQPANSTKICQHNATVRWK